MDILIQASQFILSLSLLIILHELGHFIPAKLFKTRVEKFYLFFDPWFSIIKKKIGGTEYGIGWLPLGGYVKISGMIDESMDKEQMEQPAQPWEFRSKPAWQRLIIMIGGVTVNVILAIVIYSGMLMKYGEQYLVNDSVKYGVVADSLAQTIGFQNGDRILAVDGKKMESFSEIPLEIILSDNGIVTLVRDGKEMDITIPKDEISGLLESDGTFLSPAIPYVIDSVVADMPAGKAGLMRGDSLVALNGEKMLYSSDYIDNIPQYAGKEITLSAYRGDSLRTFTLNILEDGKAGIYTDGDFLEINYKKYGFAEAIPAGFAKTGKALTDYIRQFKLIVNPETGAYKQVGGFLMIAKQFETKWNWQRFWAFTAFLSIMLAFLNILPIPALDGGHVVFVLWEMITGRKPSQKVLEYAQMVGFFILLALILLANGNDILKLFRG